MRPFYDFIGKLGGLAAHLIIVRPVSSQASFASPYLLMKHGSQSLFFRFIKEKVRLAFHQIVRNMKDRVPPLCLYHTERAFELINRLDRVFNYLNFELGGRLLSRVEVFRRESVVGIVK